MTIDKSSSVPIFQQLENLIEGWINSGKFPPGSRIPSESELSQTYHVSRVTVRRALDRLAMEGTIFRRQGKGAYVSPGKIDFNPATIFSFSEAMSTQGHTVNTQVIDQRIVPAPASLARDLSLPENSPVVLVSRLRYIDDLPATIHRSYLPARYYEAILKENLTTERLKVVMERVSGLVMAYTSDSFEAALVQNDEALLLGIPEKAPILLVRGVAYTSAGVPIRATRSIYRADLFRFQVGPRKNFEVRLQEDRLKEVTRG